MAATTKGPGAGRSPELCLRATRSLSVLSARPRASRLVVLREYEIGVDEIIKRVDAILGSSAIGFSRFGCIVCGDRAASDPDECMRGHMDRMCTTVTQTAYFWLRRDARSTKAG